MELEGDIGDMGDIRSGEPPRKGADVVVPAEAAGAALSSEPAGDKLPASPTGRAPARGEHLRLRAELMDTLRDLIRKRGLRQRDAAALFGVAQPRVSDLVRHKLALFSIDTLVDMLAACGVRVDLKVQSSRASTKASTFGTAGAAGAASDEAATRTGRTRRVRGGGGPAGA